MSTTVIYLTDNSLAEPLATRCRELLRQAAGDIPIVSVSHRPVDLGKNICIGEQKRCWMTLYRQMLAGLAAVQTDTIAIAEHDVVYHPSHLRYEPPDAKVFFYNENCWLAQGPGSSHPELLGMFSYWPRRKALSQLVCRGALLQEATEDVMRLLEMGLKVDRGLHWYGEPGCTSEQFRKAFVEANSGRPTQLQRYLKDYVQKYESAFFRTAIPNIDIRHATNWTGPKRGKDRRYELPHWGRLSDVLGEL